MMVYVGLTGLVLAGWFIRYLLRDNRSFFKRTAGTTVDVNTEIVDNKNGFVTEHFALRSSRGFTMNGYLKRPESVEKKLPVMLLLAGLFTGKDVIEMVEEIPDIEPYIILSIDYPYEGRKRLKWWQILIALPRIRKAAMNCVRGIFMILDMLEKRDDADSERIFLSGVSFGSFFGMAAAACDNRIRSVASLFGGGKIEKLVATNLPFSFSLFNKFVGITAKLIVYPLEPMHYVRYISPRPLLVVGGKEDKQFPEDCATALYDKAGDPKVLLWFQSDHPHPTNNELIRELTNEVGLWMKQQGLMEGKKAVN